jgi:Domain of Unknown Function (DUF349)
VTVTEPAWGRVAEDGTVFVRTSDGERAVGSFQAGSADDALAYFTRKFDALDLEVELFERRVRLPDVSADEASATLRRLREVLSEPAAVGDLDALRARLEAVSVAVDERRAQAKAARDESRTHARELRERIVSDAEALAGSTQWKSTGERLRELLEEWKAAPHVDRPTEQALWKRFGAARNSFDRRRRQHFAQLGAQRGEAKTAKQQLIAEAEALATSTDWGPTATQLRTLMDQWKTAGALGRSEEDALWRRFRAAQDAFYEARSAAFAERDAGLGANLAAKESLAAEAEALLPVTDTGSAKAALRGIQERWEAAGHVPRQDRDRVEGRLRKVEEAIRRADETRWRRTNPEGRARAESAVAQLVQAIDKLETQRAKAVARGDDRAVTEADESIAARRSWLEGAEAALAEFTGD